jgi:ADP-ribose pyrophosphatase YjhB (NUDIX family)
MSRRLQELWTGEAFRWHELVQRIHQKLSGAPCPYGSISDIEQRLDSLITGLHNRLDEATTRLTQDTTSYSLGFAEIIEFPGIFLLIKNKKHGLNGLGGHVEPGETPLDCMVREFAEESGVVTHPSVWQKFAVLQGPAQGPLVYVVHAYKTKISLDCAKEAKNSEEREPVALYYVDSYAGVVRHFHNNFIVEDRVEPSLLYLASLARTSMGWNPDWHLVLSEDKH